MSKRSQHRPKPTGKLIPCLISLNKILATHNKFRSDMKKIASNKTQRDRRNFYEKFFRDLHLDGYELPSVHGVGTRHVEHMIKKWVDEDKSNSSFANYLSMLKTFCTWINKNGMLNKVDLSLIPEHKLTRPVKATKNKDWSTDEDFWGRIQAVLKHDIYVGCQLLLMYAFGLRSAEARCLKVHRADGDKFLHVHWGTKGGKKRSVPNEYPVQRDVLDFAKSLVPSVFLSYSTTPRKYSKKQWENHFYHILRKNSISMQDGRVAHGLRHGYAHRQLTAKTGLLPPIISGLKLPKSEAVKAAKMEVSDALGHVRESITDAYIG